MSGAKRIMVDETAWRQAQSAAARLSDVQRDLPAMLEAARRQHQADLERTFTAVDARQSQVEQSLAGLSDQARRLEKETTRRLREQAVQLREELQTAIAETRGDLAEQERRLQAEIEQERGERQRELSALGAELAMLADDKERAAALARTHLDDARLLHDTIRDALPHDRFTPGALATLGQRIQLAETNLAQGTAQTALAGAQETYLRLGELRVELELRDREWRTAQVTAVSSLTLMLERITAGAELAVPDMEDVTLDVDYWSDGELTRLRDEVAAAADLARSDDRPLSVAELRKVVDAQAPAYQERLTEIVARAAVRQVASQVRVNVAEIVVDALESATGYAWEENAYAGEDPRDAFYSRLRQPLTGGEIVIEVAPDEETGDCAVRILSFDRDAPDEEARTQRAHLLVRSLREQGLSVGDPAGEAREPDPRDYRFDALRRRQTVRAHARPAPRQA
jgi:hypothetical protein